MKLLQKITFAILIMSFAFATQSFAQQEKDKKKTEKRNSFFSPNPPIKKPKKPTDKKSEIAENKETKKPIGKVENIKVKAEVKQASDDNETQIISTDTKNAGITNLEKNTTDTQKKTQPVSIANKTREVAKKASKENLSPTKYYKVGVGDVLYINLQNTTAKYYTVLIDGTIDYPLAGKLVSVVDLTTEDIEDLLREKITLYENPQVTVKVREYSSHKFEVKGLARIGEYFLQFEAMPLFVVKTMVGVKADADTVIIERENEDPKTILLNSSEVDELLIRTNDVLTFEKSIEAKNTSVDNSVEQYYFLSEEICDGGKKKFHSGITLVQAVFDVCGGLNTKLKEIIIIRKTESGKFISKKYDFKEILNGKQDDPTLEVNDLIDVN